MAPNPLLAIWAAVGRVRHNPWIGYVVAAWLLVIIPFFRLDREGLFGGAQYDIAILVLVAVVFTLGFLLERRRETAVLNALAQGAVGGSTLSPAEIDGLLEQGVNAEALTAVEAAIPKAPNDASLWCLWARCQLVNEQPRMATRGIDRALSVDPDHVEALYLKAWSKRVYWDFRAAHGFANEGLVHAPSHSGLRFEQRESLRNINQWSRAKALPKQRSATPAPTPRPRPAPAPAPQPQVTAPIAVGARDAASKADNSKHIEPRASVFDMIPAPSVVGEEVETGAVNTVVTNELEAEPVAASVDAASTVFDISELYAETEPVFASETPVEAEVEVDFPSEPEVAPEVGAEVEPVMAAELAAEPEVAPEVDFTPDLEPELAAVLPGFNEIAVEKDPIPDLMPSVVDTEVDTDASTEVDKVEVEHLQPAALETAPLLQPVPTTVSPKQLAPRQTRSVPATGSARLGSLRNIAAQTDAALARVSQAVEDTKVA